MNPQVKKLTHYGISEEVAERLVAAGLHTPRLIRFAPDSIIKAIRGIGQATLAIVREKIG